MVCRVRREVFDHSLFHYLTVLVARVDGEKREEVRVEVESVYEEAKGLYAEEQVKQTGRFYSVRRFLGKDAHDK